MSFNLLKEKEKLMEIMGNHQDIYWDLMRRYCRMEMNISELEEELNQLLTPKQRHSHSQFFLKFVQQKGVVDPVPLTVGQYKVPHPSEFNVIERFDVEGAIPSSMAADGLIYDFAAMMSRMKFGVAEMGLDCNREVVCLLLAAVKTFLKNILTAIVMRRKGFKRRRNGFVYSLGVPDSINTTKRQLETEEPFQSFVSFDDPTKVNEITVPKARKSPEEVERERAFNLSLQENSLAPVSLHDLLLTLQLFPTLVASNFVSSVNIERIYARLRLPYCEI